MRGTRSDGVTASVNEWGERRRRSRGRGNARGRTRRRGRGTRGAGRTAGRRQRGGRATRGSGRANAEGRPAARHHRRAAPAGAGGPDTAHSGRQGAAGHGANAGARKTRRHASTTRSEARADGRTTKGRRHRATADTRSAYSTGAAPLGSLTPGRPRRRSDTGPAQRDARPKRAQQNARRETMTYEPLRFGPGLVWSRHGDGVVG